MLDHMKDIEHAIGDVGAGHGSLLDASDEQGPEEGARGCPWWIADSAFSIYLGPRSLLAGIVI